MRDGRPSLTNIEHPSKIKIVLAFTAIYFIWGSTYLAIRYAVETVPPFFMGFTRFVIAGAIILLIVKLKKEKPATKKDWVIGAISGSLMFGGGNGAVQWASQFMPSSLAAIVVATIPIWMILFHWIQSKANKPDLLTMAGVIVGIIGVILLTEIEEEVLINNNQFGGTVILGMIVLIMGTMSWSAGSLYYRNSKPTVSSMNMAGIQTFCGGFTMLIISLFKGEPQNFDVSQVSLLSVFSMTYLILFGTLIAFLSYVWLLKASTPAKVSTYAYFNPLVAILLGGLIAGELLTIHMFLGGAAILISIILINKPWKQLKLLKK